MLTRRRRSLSVTLSLAFILLLLRDATYDERLFQSYHSTLIDISNKKYELPREHNLSKITTNPHDADAWLWKDSLGLLSRMLLPFSALPLRRTT